MKKKTSTSSFYSFISEARSHTQTLQHGVMAGTCEVSETSCAFKLFNLAFIHFFKPQIKNLKYYFMQIHKVSALQ